MTRIDLTPIKDKIGVFLFSGSLDENHIKDIAALHKGFKAYGIPAANIKIYLPEDFIPCNQLVSDLSTTEFEYIIIVFSGHGAFDPEIGYGVAFEDTSGLHIISAHSFYSSIEANRNIKFCLPIFGQCFAGVFNYANTRMRSDLVICPMGATGIHASLNYYVDELSYHGNVFLAYIAHWLNSPVDVNDDGQKTLIDLYFYANGRTSKIILNLRSYLFFEIKRLDTALLNNMLSDIQRSAILDKIKDLVETLHILQEPWLLNANQFREVYF